MSISVKEGKALQVHMCNNSNAYESNTCSQFCCSFLQMSTGVNKVVFTVLS